MLNEIPTFARIVAASFQELIKNPENVFVVDIDGDALFAEYLVSFPEGTNPIFKKRTDHDCSCCKQFIRRAGVVVSFDGNEMKTVWDKAADEAPGAYRIVATRLRDLVRAANVANLFRVSEKELAFGAVKTRQLDADTGAVHTWDHLYTGEIPRALRSATPDTVRGDYRTTVQVLTRGLTELKPDAVETVLSLIESNALYRGEEHKPALLAFQKLQKAFLALPNQRFAWANAGQPAARFRNTVIGTLVQDLSEGAELEYAVKGFETKVAPQNYKRTTALITPGMVKKAMETIESLGLEEALERRFARIEDVSVTDVKWVDGSVRSAMKGGGLQEVLMKHAATSVKDKETDHAEDISLDVFMKDVLPTTTGMEILFKSEHVGNLMSLTAPVNLTTKRLFRWSNDFAWSYGGNVADSIKERVKKAGGNVAGVMRVSLSWFNFDDLDLHIKEPPGRGAMGLYGNICYSNKRGWTGGVLDVDMNAGGGHTREAVENVIWTKAPPDGAYMVAVNNFNRRETADPGFVIEVESGGKVSHFSYNKGVGMKDTIMVAGLHVKNGVIEHIEPGDPAVTASNISQEKWGLKTEQFVKVTAVTLSPNYWGDNAVGNKHTFFVLDGAKNDEAARGFFNEFLHPRLEPHRKVFEVIADKTKCPPSNEQLSGLGFSSTLKTSFIVRARQGKKQRLFNVNV